LDECTTLDEAQDVIVPLLNVANNSGNKFVLRRMEAMKSSDTTYWTLSARVGVVTLKSLARKDRDQINVVFVLLDDADNCIVVKKFDGISLRVERMCSSLDNMDCVLEEFNQWYFDRSFCKTIAAGDIVVSGDVNCRSSLNSKKLRLVHK
jgi:hypothetical protein